MADPKRYILPSLKEAQKRTQRQVVIERALFELPAETRNLGAGKKYFLRTYGCQANERDSETISGILEAMGFLRVDVPENADLILFNTCAVRKNAEDKVLGEIGHLKGIKKKNPDVVFGVCGCMAQEEAVVHELMRAYRHVELIFGTHNIHRLPELLHNVMVKKQKSIEVFSKEGDIIENLPAKRNMKHKAWVNIMYGCDKFCTYCIVPYTRGKERSRTMDDILKEVVELKESGVKEVTLLGQNVNAYGKDLKDGSNFAELLHQVALTGIERIRFMTSHPWDFTDEMIDVIAAHDNIMKYIHLPVQSGSTEILKIMGRRYTREEYKALFDKITARIPGCAFSADIIVGFPNETEEQFMETMEMVDYCKYDNVYSFIYSPREGTPAAKMEDNVPLEVKQQRLYALQDKINGYCNMNNQKWVGKTVKVLVDGPSRKNDQVYSGYTEQNKLVNFTGNDVHSGEIIDVKITEHRSWTLRGEKVE